MSHFAHFLLAQELLDMTAVRPRSEALSSQPGIGDKLASVLRSLRARAGFEAAESPSMPALLDYPYRS